MAYQQPEYQPEYQPQYQPEFPAQFQPQYSQYPPQKPQPVRAVVSVWRIAVGVFLGLMMFSVVSAVVTLVTVWLLASAIHDAVNELDTTTSLTSGS